ncbi:MAG: response regulator [Gemmatimonadales bacterium]
MRPLRGNGELILIVDDEAGLRDVTARTLQFFGYRTVTAAHGAEAMAIYQERRDELAAVLTDLVMPVMDGPATINALRAVAPRLPLIAVSGLTDIGTDETATSLGVDGFLAKPFTVDELVTMLARVLRTG